jgi:hypothetical protein
VADGLELGGVEVEPTDDDEVPPVAGVIEVLGEPVLPPMSVDVDEVEVDEVEVDELDEPVSVAVE